MFFFRGDSKVRLISLGKERRYVVHSSLLIYKFNSNNSNKGNPFVHIGINTLSYKYLLLVHKYISSMHLFPHTHNKQTLAQRCTSIPTRLRFLNYILL